MALIIISFIFIISLAFGNSTSTQVKDVPFDVKEMIDRVTHPRQVTPRTPNSEFQQFDQGEFLIDTSIVYTNAPGSQVNPKIAYNGTNYLVVWQDSRNGSGIYGARVTPEGSLLDSIGISIDNGAYVKHLPSVASDGNNYLVVWRDGRINPDYSRIYGSRISQNGEVLDTNGIRISPGIFMEEEPSISFDGTNYLVVWQDNRTLWDIYGARVTPTGTVLDTAGFPISVAGSYQWSPSVTFNGNSYFNNNNYLVVWQDRRSGSDIYGARVTPAGRTLDTNGILISIAIATSDQQHPYVSSNGTDYLVVWQDNRNGNWDIYGARVTSTGTLLDSAGIPISTAINDQIYPSITFKDNNYMVVWFDGRNGHNEIYGARITQTGTVLDPNGIEISVSGSRASIAFDDTNYFVASGGRTDDIYVTRLTPVGTVLDTPGILISYGINSQTTSSVAFDGTNYLIVWADTRNVKEDIYGIRVDQYGNALDPASIAISTANNSQIYPSVAFDGTNYLVVWQDLRNSSTSWDIYGARVTQAGVVLDPEGIAITNLSVGQWCPAVAFDGSNYLVTWGISNSRGIYGARVNQEGVVLDTAGIQINYWEGIFSDVAFGDTNYLVVWEEFGTIPNYYNIKGTRVSPQGIVIGPTITIALNGQYYPSVAFDGTNYLVTWEDGANIFGALVSQTGTILNRITICGAQNSQARSSIAFGDTNYLVVWVDERNGINDDIYGAKVAPSGSIISSFPISRQSGVQSVPDLAHGMRERFLITYTGWTDSINHHPANIMRIWGKFSSDIGIAEQNPKVNMQIAKFFEIFPNPAKGVIRVRIPWSAEEQADIKIFDVSGTLVKEEKVTSAQSHKQELRISLKGISPGIYFLRMGKETKKFLVFK